MIPHRGPAFRALYSETLELAREIHRTDGDVLTWAATGSAGWEVAVVNLLSPGDPVLVAVNGNFGAAVCPTWRAASESTCDALMSRGERRFCPRNSSQRSKRIPT